jgi:hypothetical protein
MRLNSRHYDNGPIYLLWPGPPFMYIGGLTIVACTCSHDRGLGIVAYPCASISSLPCCLNGWRDRLANKSSQMQSLMDRGEISKL